MKQINKYLKYPDTFSIFLNKYIRIWDVVSLHFI